MKQKRVFAFDMGKASIGYCVREGHDIKVANSIIISKDHADMSSIRASRRVRKTLEAHKSREQFFNEIWKNCNQELLDKNDLRFTKEFPTKNENIIYTSCLLRIALLQNKKLEKWQIYKALHNALQRRGYDANLPWKATQTDDDKYNKELTLRYTQEDGVELISSEEYKYPCYYDALRLGLWTEDKPEKLKKSIPLNNYNKVRCTEYVAPRTMVIKELTQLWINAQKQIPELNKYDVDEFLFGEYKEQYGSYLNKDFRSKMGSNADWQGVLGQKIPRFNNRIISKCKLLPKRNVCKAETLENVSFVLLMKLKNLRLTDISGEKIKLSPTDIKNIYENWLNKYEEKNKKLDTTITKKEIEKIIGRTIPDKIEPLKANLSGRSSFCRRACEIMKKVILSGELYPQNLNISEFVDNPNTKNGITEEEIKEMLSKVGDWNNLYIPDNREENARIGDNTREKTDLVIGSVTNPIVRNRLQIFRDLLYKLELEHGKPDEVIFEFVREGADNSLMGAKKANQYMKEQNDNQKANEQIKKELGEDLNGTNFLKLKLLKMQGGKCVYSGRNISPSDFNACEIDHIFPRSQGGNDALYNKVLCYREANQQKKEQTPYEWLSKDADKWAVYVNRLTAIKTSLGQKKFELLTSSPEECKELIDSYNGLAETAYIARLAQEITGLMFGWGLQVEGEKRHIFVDNGSTTHAIRKRYKLNRLLGDDEKKNRENDKHHALDAICISYSREFKYNKELKADVIDGFSPELVEMAIRDIMPYPYANKKPLKANTNPLETIYGYRNYKGKNYITNRIDITSLEQKEKKIRTIVDETIKNDLLEKVESLSKEEWNNLLKDYVHPKKRTRVKKVLTIVSEGELEHDFNTRERIGEYCDFGAKGTKHQFKHSKGHKGQILYYNEKGAIKVMPVYSNVKTSEVREKLLNMGCKLYNKGQMFYSGCLLDIPNEFLAGKETYPAGIYKLKTITTAGQIKLENNVGIEPLTSAQNLANAKFKKYQ